MSLAESLVRLSDRQRRVCQASMQAIHVAARLNALAIRMPETQPVPDCIAALERVCAQIDSLTAIQAWQGEVPCWKLSPPATAYRLQGLTCAAGDLREYLDSIAELPQSADALAPLMVSPGGVHDGYRLWFLAVGAARCDLIGLEELARQWSQCLEGAAGSEAPPPQWVTVQATLARAIESAEARAAMVYWNRHLQDPEQPAGVAEGGGHHTGRFDPRKIAIVLPEGLLESLQQRYAVSARTLLTAAWIALTNRATGSSRAFLWQRFTGRLAPELRQFVGCLGHFLPLTQRVRWTATCSTFVRELERALSMHERLQDSFSVAGVPIAFGIQPDLQCAIREAVQPTQGLRIVEAVEGGEPFRLKLTAELRGNDGDIALHYDAAVVRQVQAQCLAVAFARILAGLGRPESTVAEACAPLAAALAPVMAAEWGAARPEWIAGDELGQMLLRGLVTCRVFDSAASAEGASFRARVLGRVAFLRAACRSVQQPMLGLVASNCVEAATTTVAALLAAIPVAFVDPRAAPLRKQSALERVGATLLIGTREGLAELAAPLPSHVFESLPRERPEDDAGADIRLESPSPEAIAYVVFSSGSTGTPKPIAVPRRALQNQLLWLRERLPLGTDDVLLHRSPLGFDAAVWELLHPVCSGAQLVIPPTEAATDSHRIAREVERHGVTALQLTPYLLRAIHEDRGFEHLDSLRLLVSGGDRLPRKLAADVLGSAPLHLVNAYGPSECCIQVSIGAVTLQECASGLSSAPIGAPMPNSGMHILSQSLEPLLDGSVGRLFLSGCPLGQGYPADLAATAAVFIPLPGGTVPGARMYDTGDLARRVGDAVEVLGRADKRLKVNGVQVDLDAIENCLRTVDRVRDAAVVAVRDDEFGTGYLTAFLITDAPAGDIAAAARSLVAHSLPSTCQPAHYLCLADLPVTDRGKVDSEALTRSAIAKVMSPAVPPGTALERTIADVWKAVLKQDDVGIHDDFFLSGGHSLLFAQVITRLRQKLALDIPLRAIFMHPTIARLAQHIEELRQEAGRAAAEVKPSNESTVL